MISIIVAVGKNYEIGKNGKMLWHIPEELLNFRRITLNHKIVMGRKTFEAIGRKLDNRENIILTKSNIYDDRQDIKIVKDIKEILKYSNSLDEIFIIGGESIYKQFIDYADKIYISHINREYVDADRFFPKFDKNKYKLIEKKEYKEYVFEIYKRRQMNKNFYVTTPIYYPNAKPHVGTSYSTIIADVLARYKKLEGYNVKFVTGIDEHGQKIQESAIKNNMSPIEWVDIMSRDFKKLWEALNVKYTDFIRTTNDKHKITVTEMLKKAYDNGDIYKSEYIGKYCVSEETYVTDSQLVDGKYMGKEVIEVKEPSYFFRLSKYQDKLLKFYEENPHFITPENRKNEVIAFIKQGLQDLSISRTTFSWGIPLEFEKGHVVYVWFDALNSYLTGAGKSINEEEFNMFWNNAEVCHILGKDILRFHAIIWPAMLMATNQKLPDKLLTHGWWTSEGEKMSKSLGNVVNPFEEIEKYGVDAFRYFIIRESNFEKDSDYSKKAIINRINSDLANDLGNLLNRTLAMVNKYTGGKINIQNINNEKDTSLLETYRNILIDNEHQYNSYNLSEVLKNVWKYISSLNKYIDENEIWNLAKDETQKERLLQTLYRLLDGIYKVSYMIYPFMPETSHKINKQLGIDINFENEININMKKDNSYPNDIKIGNSEVLFPRIEIEKEEFSKEIKINNPITIEDFNKIDISVVEILEAYEVPTTSFIRLIINTGIEKRQVMSNMKKHYNNLSDLKGKKVLAIINLEPIEIQGYLSQAMLLTVSKKKNSKFIEVDSTNKIGLKVK